MLLLTHNYRIPVKVALKRAGYVKHPDAKKKGEWIIEEHPIGRWHAKILADNVATIHYDLYIDGKHVSCFSLPIKHGEERKRIRRTIRWAKTRDMDEKEFMKFRDKYGGFMESD